VLHLDSRDRETEIILLAGLDAFSTMLHASFMAHAVAGACPDGQPGRTTGRQRRPRGAEKHATYHTV
jgi:hypothetical protein